MSPWRSAPASAWIRSSASRLPCTAPETTIVAAAMSPTTCAPAWTTTRCPATSIVPSTRPAMTTSSCADNSPLITTVDPTVARCCIMNPPGSNRLTVASFARGVPAPAPCIPPDFASTYDGSVTGLPICHGLAGPGRSAHGSLAATLRPERDPIAEMAMTAQRDRRSEFFDEHPTGGEDDTLRGDIPRSRGDLHVAQTFTARVGQQRSQGARGRPEAPLPGHDRIADVAETVRRQRLASGLPPEADAAAELTVPHPPVVSGKSPHGRAVGQLDRITGGFSVHEAGKEALGIEGNPRQLLARRGLLAEIVRRPATLEGRDILRQVLACRPDQLHRWHSLFVRDRHR